MLSTWVGIALMAALLVWLLGVGKRQDRHAPEDDVDTPIDVDELVAAEREIKDDPDARAAADAVDNDQDDDWGPGSGGHGPLPGIT